MAIKIKSVKEAVEDNGIKMLVHGPAGVGKTCLCATGGCPTLIISAEAGLLSIANAPAYVEVTEEISSIEELEDVYDYLIGEGKGKYELVCLDSVSEIAEVLLAEEKSKNKDARAAYGNLSERMTKIMRMFRDLPNIHVLFTCKQKRFEDNDTGIVSFVPSLPGAALTQSISYLFDEVFALRVEKDTGEEGESFDYRTLQCDRDRKYEAKDRSGNLDMFEEPNLKRLLVKIRDEEGEVDEPKKEDADGAGDLDDSDQVGDAGDSEGSLDTEGEVLDQTDEAEAVDEDSHDDVEEDLEEDVPGYEVVTADKKLYWIHHESYACGVIAKGEGYKPDKYAENGAEFVTLGMYKDYKGSLTTSED